MRPMLLWEAFLTFLTTGSAGLGLVNALPAKTVGIIVIVVQSLNAATVVYKTGQWNPQQSTVTTSHVVVSTLPTQKTEDTTK